MRIAHQLLQTVLAAICLFVFGGCFAVRPETYGTLNQRILVLLPDAGLDDLQFTIAETRLSLAGNTLTYASLSGGSAVTVHNRTIYNCRKLNTLDPSQYDALLLINGAQRSTFASDPDFIRICTHLIHRDKPIAASGYATAALAPFLNGMKASAFPSEKPTLERSGAVYTRALVTADRNFLTGFGGSDENDTLFIHSFIRMLAGKKEPVVQSAPDIPFTVYDNGGRFVLTHGGKTRSGVITVPNANHGAAQKSLVFGLHWTAAVGEQFRIRGFDELAPELDFIMVYPDGYNGDWEIMPDRESRLDEKGLFKTLIREFCAHYPIAADRIYATGFSLGSFAVYKLAGEFPNTFAAVAPVSGLMYPTRERPISDSGNLKNSNTSLLHIHCLDDRNVPFTGDPVYGIPVAAEKSVSYWRRAVRAEPNAAPYPAPAGATAKIWSNPETGADIVLATYETGGHAWQPETTAYVADFFYNHPPRENRVQLATADLPAIAESGQPLGLSVRLENAASVQRIVYKANGAVIGTAQNAPFAITWIPPENGRYALSARAELTSGTSIASTLNPEIYVAYKNIAAQAEPAASASSTETAFLSADKAFDSDPRTRWASAYADDQYLTVDLGKTVPISGVTVLWEAAYATAYEIRISNDGRNWHTVYETAQGAGGDETVAFSPVTGRFVRLDCTERATKWGFSVWELLVHGESR
ncbi:discoidin domain-containing protein [Treponema brennaborense]|uniref:Coagulation factor 5/8 type domain protein n=1 Tax=Treponema brennaborense (strain DSM 12168 / CIP 105900 / DD5/3) TaxID=906968 RepID=F4LII5_TREBD|nr:discoidin domain-containing protein [Treponema brennaborense]AEE17210.1 coagulation factor 5/8 type domain protein [Treponema brennaborense DSM 12168]